jgi:hypothetical protein
LLFSNFALIWAAARRAGGAGTTRCGADLPKSEEIIHGVRKNTPAKGPESVNMSSLQSAHLNSGEGTMRKLSYLAGALLAFGLAGPAAAGPLPGPGAAPEVDSLVHKTQGYRYHRTCYWTGTGWGYKSGTKILVCRPFKPVGRYWVWHTEGPKHGWYHTQKKTWHHTKW